MLDIYFNVVVIAKTKTGVQDFRSPGGMLARQNS
jgi:hypothetical protein